MMVWGLGGEGCRIIRRNTDMVRPGKHGENFLSTRDRSQGNHNARVLVPIQQRIFPTLCFCVFDICPSFQEVFVSGDASELASDRTIYVLHNVEIGRKEDVKVALVDLKRCLVSISDS